MKRIFYGLLTVSSFLLIGCGASVMSIQVPQTKRPIDVSSYQLPKVGVAKVSSSLIPGSVIGGHFDGLARVKQQHYYAQGFVGAEWESQYKKIIAEELSNAGYSTSIPSSLFDSDESFNARFLIGGTITKSVLQSFGSFAGNYTEDLVEIDWEVFDKESRKTVYKSKTSGYMKIDGVSIEVTPFAFRTCIRNFLADANLVATLKSTTSAPTVAVTTAAEVSFYESNERLDKSTNKIEAAARAVFAIRTEEGHGSGFIINPKGYALTNYHVVEGRNFFDAIFIDGKTIRVNVVKTDPSKDLALLKLTGEDYPFLALAEVQKLVLGQEVYAIGTPLTLGLSHTVSKGVVSGIRKLEKFTLVQTDASVNPGNSGGPLITADGKVAGIVSLKLAQSGIEGLGFAISPEEAVKTFQLVRMEKE
ncbi:MAG: S1C family serine protease [Ignavibacteria bacterium]|nr:S1C family serine protease [Ignavibacteria bacterium]